ncbi:GNAT family N-acetyltransferase [Ferruginibacter sp.]|uniref:GNAT family N-acetyltransferase n=1 Tax=Ferruginibacter sp. TaxID=1940288 RepID=UPI0019B2D16C|nr:GNAT family protein [Ferruginibacter sp.]MBC7627365.1 GNAT family N-acetyltransferase [Ferruginibacter sp.]
MIVLEYFGRNDFDQLMKWIEDDELLMNWSGSLFSYPLTLKSLEWYIDDVNDINNSDAFIYKAVDVVSGKTVGHISLGSISKKNKSGRISRVLVGGNDNRGRGCCQQMVKAVLKIGFEELQLHRISLGVYDFNTAAINCYKKSGLIVEGITRDVLNFKGNWWSLVEMSILEKEWNNRV